MTAVQEIQAAIDKLTALKAISTPGAWAVYNAHYSPGVSIHAGADDYSPLINSGEYAASLESFENPLDAELIVTLHRTIDAQLAILEVATAYGELGEGEGSRFIIAAKLLARAINGPAK